MPKFSVGDRVVGTYSGYPVGGTVVWSSDKGLHLHIRLDQSYISTYIEGWLANQGGYNYGPGLYWSVMSQDMRLEGPPTTTREMSRKLLREMGYA